MNVLILGRNAINSEVEKFLACESIATMLIPDAAEVVKFKGAPGNYIVTTPASGSDAEKYSFTSVIITEAPQFEGLAVDSSLTLNIMDDDETGRLLAGKPGNLATNEKIVILLDYAGETPEYITARAIELAKQLAEKKKELVFLAKTIKSGYGDNEIRYREARNTGVSFVKYEKLSLCYNEETDIFKIEANDGVFDINIDTPYVLSAVFKETPALKAISKKLRLYQNPDGTINDDRFFLFPVFTSRRGIYYLNPALVMPEPPDHPGVVRRTVGQAISSIIEDMAMIGNGTYEREIVRGRQFPKVDPNKCAFCYSCFRVCPHGALEPDLEASAMKVIESECEACGTCIAICPGEAIARQDSPGPSWSEVPWKDITSQPAGKDETLPGPGRVRTNRQQAPLLRCKIYCCENGAAAAFEEALPSLGEYKEIIDCERVACGGSVGTDMLAGDFMDYKTVIIACCVEDACRHMGGDRRACKQSVHAAELLRKAGLENRRVEVIKVSHANSGVLKDNILSILEGQI